MNSVKITPNASTGKVISAYDSNPSFGFVMLTQTSMVVGAGWIRQQKRSSLLRAEVDVLKMFVDAYPKLELPGNLVVKEYLESQVPEDVQATHINPKVAWEDGISGFIKRAGQGGPELTVGGERILRFTEYDATGEIQDITVNHDNQTEVAQNRVTEGAEAVKTDAKKAKFEA